MSFEIFNKNIPDDHVNDERRRKVMSTGTKAAAGVALTGLSTEKSEARVPDYEKDSKRMFESAIEEIDVLITELNANRTKYKNVSPGFVVGEVINYLKKAEEKLQKSEEESKSDVDFYTEVKAISSDIREKFGDADERFEKSDENFMEEKLEDFSVMHVIEDKGIAIEIRKFFDVAQKINPGEREIETQKKLAAHYFHNFKSGRFAKKISEELEELGVDLTEDEVKEIYDKKLFEPNKEIMEDHNLD